MQMEAWACSTRKRYSSREPKGSQNKKERMTVKEQAEKTMEEQIMEELEQEMVFVNVYKVTREYGGAEEGGWYYDHYRCINAVPCASGTHAETIQGHLERKYAPLAYGNISSVLGGAEIRVLIEGEPGESATTSKPIYE